MKVSQVTLLRDEEGNVTGYDFWDRFERIEFDDGTVWTASSGPLRMLGTDAGSPTRGTPLSDHILGSGGNDRDLDGYDGDDTIDGGAGDDTLDGGAGNDRLIGGSGVDTMLWRNGRRHLCTARWRRKQFSHERPKHLREFGRGTRYASHRRRGPPKICT